MNKQAKFSPPKKKSKKVPNYCWKLEDKQFFSRTSLFHIFGTQLIRAQSSKLDCIHARNFS